jgi:hypothetical protein
MQVWLHAKLKYETNRVLNMQDIDKSEIYIHNFLDLVWMIWLASMCGMARCEFDCGFSMTYVCCPDNMSYSVSDLILYFIGPSTNDV